MPKGAKNALTFFLQTKVMKQYQTRSFKEALEIGNPMWKAMSEDQRRPYKEMETQEKKRLRGVAGDEYRLTTAGKNMAEERREEEERQERERDYTRIAQAEVPQIPDEILEKVFHFVAFEQLIETDEGDSWPAEMAAVSYSLSRGIIAELQYFIDTGPLPKGMYADAKEHSDKYHKIPFCGFPLADDNYIGMYNSLVAMIDPERTYKCAPLFAVPGELTMTRSCLEWVYGRQVGATRQKAEVVVEADVLMTELYERKGQSMICSLLRDRLTTEEYTWKGDTLCSWHSSEGVPYCALRKVKSMCYAISADLQKLYGFRMTGAHTFGAFEGTDLTDADCADQWTSSSVADSWGVSQKSSGWGGSSNSGGWGGRKSGWSQQSNPAPGVGRGRPAAAPNPWGSPAPGPVVPSQQIYPTLQAAYNTASSSVYSGDDDDADSSVGSLLAFGEYEVDDMRSNISSSSNRMGLGRGVRK